MGLFRVPDRPLPKPKKRSRSSLLLFLLLVYAGAKLLGAPHRSIFNHINASAKLPLPILMPAGSINELAFPPLYHFTGTRVRGNGIYLDLGDRRTDWPGSLLARFFPNELIVPSCLTQLAPAPFSPQVAKPLPIRDDWPGFYGAPWVAQLDGNLIALLHVYAPRNAGSPVAPPEFQFYPNYDGQRTSPEFDQQAPATFQRGTKAVLYRVFLNGSFRCLDLVVQNGENNGIGHLYYQKYHHYYQMDTIFQIQP